MGERKRAKRKGELVTRPRIELALVLIRAGKTVTQAAEAIGCHPTTLYRILPNEYADEYAEAKEASALARADDGRELARQLAHDGHPKALDFYLRANVPEYNFKETKQVQITGADSGPIQVEGRAVVGLADVNRLAVQLGVGHLVGLDAPDPRGELAAPADVLPGADPGERPPSIVPEP